MIVVMMMATSISKSTVPHAPPSSPDKQYNLENRSYSFSSLPLLCNANRQAATVTCMIWGLCGGIANVVPKGMPSKKYCDGLGSPVQLLEQGSSCHFVDL
jgi:hypothetical protein